MCKVEPFLALEVTFPRPRMFPLPPWNKERDQKNSSGASILKIGVSYFTFHKTCVQTALNFELSIFNLYEECPFQTFCNMFNILKGMRCREGARRSSRSRSLAPPPRTLQ